MFTFSGVGSVEKDMLCVKSIFRTYPVCDVSLASHVCLSYNAVLYLTDSCGFLFCKENFESSYSKWKKENILNDFCFKHKTFSFNKLLT